MTMHKTEQYKTEQEDFWAGQFGNEYMERNKGDVLVGRNIAVFAKILSRTTQIKSMIEFGSNVGLNLRAIKTLIPNIELSAIEINQKAVEELQEWGHVRTYHQSIFSFEPDYTRDLVLTRGVLIHINPEKLHQVYDLLYRTTKRYICVAEYYNPTPVESIYRGHNGKLFKRDFAGELLDLYPDLKLVDYGFVYHRDTQFPWDDTSWFLLEKVK